MRSWQWSSDRSEDAHSRALLEMVEMWDQIPQSLSNVALWRAYFVLCTVSSASQWQCHLSCNLQPSSLAVKSGSPAILDAMSMSIEPFLCPPPMMAMLVSRCASLQPLPSAGAGCLLCICWASLAAPLTSGDHMTTRHTADHRPLTRHWQVSHSPPILELVPMLQRHHFCNGGTDCSRHNTYNIWGTEQLLIRSQVYLMNPP